MFADAPGSAAATDIDYICVAADLLSEMMSELESLKATNRRCALAMATAGHDLRQKLHTLLGTVDQLNSNHDPVRGSELTQSAKALIQRLAAGLEELALLAEQDHRQATPAPYCFEISPLLGQIKSDWEAHAAAKQLKFNFSVVECLVRSDQRLLAVILNNIVGNAITHTVRGGVTVAPIIAGPSVILTVSDTGPGISDEDIRRSYNFSSRYGLLNEGMGLGLSIARKTAEVLGHEFDISTGLNFGTCVRLHVPLVLRS